jgi:hypothetical protein
LVKFGSGRDSGEYAFRGLCDFGISKFTETAGCAAAGVSDREGEGWFCAQRLDDTSDSATTNSGTFLANLGDRLTMR